MLERSCKEGRLQHIHAAGKAGYAAMCEALTARGVPLSGGGICVREYIDDMPRCMAAADLVICRCGAMTMSELPAAGKPAILIPSPYVAEDHQRYNAMALVDKGAARCLEEKDLTAGSLWALIGELTAWAKGQKAPLYPMPPSGSTARSAASYRTRNKLSVTRVKPFDIPCQ